MDLSSSFLQGTREFSHIDANELLLIACNKEILLEKERRWLQLPAYTSYGSKLVPNRSPKFLTKKFVPESYIRNDEVSCDVVSRTVEESFRSFCTNQSQHHAVANSFDPCNGSIMGGKERILSITRGLTNSALYSIACMVTRNNLKFKRTRPELIEIVKDHFTNYLLDVSQEPDELSRLSKIFKNPNSYLQNNLQTVTPFTEHLRVSISKTLDRLKELTVRELDAIFQKLNGVKVKPHFPPVIKTHCSTQTLLLRVEKLCSQYLSNLQDDQEIPKKFANGLTVIILALHCKSDHILIPISEFCPFPDDVMCTQMEILHAMRALPKLRKEEIETLIRLIDPTSMVPRSSFRNTLRKYMMEYLFVCDEMNVPKELLRAVDIINKRSEVGTNLFSKENRDKEVEAVLNVSCYLKSVSTNLILEREIEGSVDAVESERNDEGENNWHSDNNDFEFCGTDYFLNLVGEGLGKDLEGFSSNYMSESVNSAKGSFSADSYKIPKKSSENGSSNNGSEIEINEICDEASVVAHKLIGHMIHGFLKLEKKEADEWTTSYLTDGLPNANNDKGRKTKSNTDEEANILFNSVEGILPSFPKSSLAKVKFLMKL
ncbi:DNA double-strand break repair protein [Rhynchospora pubera]|uniref:DNA double-strand break repair protein n=1 Tax=Rhynchospora pubera TaxID=906938 RepID=A0AAV8HHQ6_9POAL|nr:DNA double-strand break repair protein [Rhynchospora pubera]KAJ4814322.1 DNA double-strand break repair protein [Rhynchospora pubera]